MLCSSADNYREAEDSLMDDLERPLCKCHGEPMVKDGHERGRQKWQCRVVERARQARLYTDPRYVTKKCAHQREQWPHSEARDVKLARYQERKARGLCTKCGAPGLSETLCWDCLNYQEEYSALNARG